MSIEALQSSKEVPFTTFFFYQKFSQLSLEYILSYIGDDQTFTWTMEKSSYFN